MIWVKAAARDRGDHAGMNMIDAFRRHGLFDARVPRYTSYPTAPHFSAEVGPDHACDWLRAVPAGAEVSLYVHIPFCRRLCWFCACRTQGTSTLKPVEAYVDTLIAEFDLIAARLAPGVTLRHLHWGGGTPTLLSPGLIARLATAIAARFPFAPGAQFSVEIDPAEVDGARLDALAAAGMNRASVGVQDFDPAIQKRIGREQGFELTRDVIAAIRARGIGSVNIDMLYGLPGQDRAGLARTVDQVIDLAPSRVALYGYAHVPWMSKRQKLIPAEMLPDAVARLGLFEAARDRFVAAGYDEIGIDHFALPGDTMATAQAQGKLRRNFQGYTEDAAEVLIGAGASSISRYPQGYAQNAPATAAYQDAVRNGRLATSRGHVFTHDDRLRARMIEELMCHFRVPLRDLAVETGTDEGAIRAVAAGALAAFPEALLMDGVALQVRPEWRPLARVIARYFDAYEMSASGHSLAI